MNNKYKRDSNSTPLILDYEWCLYSRPTLCWLVSCVAVVTLRYVRWLLRYYYGLLVVVVVVVVVDNSVILLCRCLKLHSSFVVFPCWYRFVFRGHNVRRSVLCFTDIMSVVLFRVSRS